MKTVVVGGTGLIGSRVVPLLEARGHAVVVAARSTGVNSFTGEGLAEALEGADVVVDVSNSSYTDEEAALEFFEASTLNLLTYGAAAGVRHHVALSVVGTDRLAASEGGYFKAKAVQEDLIRASHRPFTIVHATQFFEFLRSIADDATSAGRVQVSHALIQPMAADDVALAVADAADAAPLGGMIEYGGPDRFRLDDLLRTTLRARHDPREVVADPLARYFGSALSERELLPADDARTAATSFGAWLERA